MIDDHYPASCSEAIGIAGPQISFAARRSPMNTKICRRSFLTKHVDNLYSVSSGIEAYTEAYAETIDDGLLKNTMDIK